MQSNYFNTTSKVLTWVSWFFYIIVMIIAIICKIVLKEDITFALSFLHQLILMVFTYYFCKSGVENIVSIIVDKVYSAKSLDANNIQKE